MSPIHKGMDTEEEGTRRAGSSWAEKEDTVLVVAFLLNVGVALGK